MHLEVIGLQPYRNDVKVCYRGPGRKMDTLEKRGEITEFSERSRRRLAFVASNTDVRFRSLMTLTYPKQYTTDGREVKRHFDLMLRSIRRRYDGVSYLWFIEFQRRGAPHYHILLTAKPSKECQQWCSQRWYEIVGSQDPKHLAAGTQFVMLRKRRGGAHYAVKYAMKMRQKYVPERYRNVGRFWGHSKDVKPEPLTPPIKIDDLEQMFYLLSGWEYLPHLDKPVSVLYNATNSLAGNLNLD